MRKSRNEKFAFPYLRTITSRKLRTDVVVLRMTVIDIIITALRGLLLVFFGGQALAFIGVVLWLIWTDAIKPRLIPRQEIDRVAADIIASFPDPEEEAFARYERAWYRSDAAEQIYCYRVWKAVRKRLARMMACPAARDPRLDLF